MKKTLKLFGLVALSAFVFSCTKETALDIEKENITPADEQQAETPDTPVIPATDGGLLTSFGVTFEGHQDADTKVTVDLGEGTTAIENGDEVLVYVSASNKAVYAYNKDESKFELSSGGPVTLDAPASVFYPADEFDEETGVFTMPAAVTDLEDLGDKAPMAGQIEGSAGAYTVDLKNLASVLKVGVTGATSNTLTSVTLAATGKSVEAGAAYTVDFSGARPVLATEAADAASSMVVSAGGAALSGTAKTFFFLVPAGLSLGDVTVTATLGENHNGGNDTFSISNTSFTPDANKIIGMSFYAGLFSGGAGTPGDPYKIANARDFKYISKYCAEGYTPSSMTAASFLGATYKQTADIDLKSSALTPIGNSSATSAQFKGHYDGNSKTLKNVSVNVDTQFAAVFGYVSGSAEIKNLTVTGSVTKTGTTDYSCAAGIVGILNGSAQVTGCTNRATVTSTATYTGGVVGRMYAATAGISDCKNLGIIEGVSNVGGVVGQLNAGALSSSRNSGKVTASGECVGGIAGQMNGASVIENCSNDAMITSESSASSYAAGIVGKSNGSEGSVVSCVNEGYVTANKPFTGGIAGDMNGTIDKCINKGMIESTSSNVGGIAGSLRASSIVKRSYSSKGKTITGTNRVGGVVGIQNGAGSWVVSCFSNSNVTGTANTADYGVGGIVGILTNGTVANCSTGDVTVICSASCSKAADAKVYVGGIVGYQNADGTIQNVYSPLYAKDIKIGSIHGRSVSGKIGQIAGYAGGPLIGYYFGGCATATTGWQYWGTTASDPTPTHLAQWAFTSANNVSMDWSAPVAKNYSNFGVSFTSGTYYLSDVMNVAISQDPLASGYTPVTGEVLTWSARDAANNDYHPIPDALLTLGADYYDN